MRSKDRKTCEVCKGKGVIIVENTKDGSTGCYQKEICKYCYGLGYESSWSK